jgi:hypothetical protein
LIGRSQENIQSNIRGVVIRISYQAKGFWAGVGAALLFTLPMSSPLLAADPPPLTDTSAKPSPAVAPGVNAQRMCAAPAAEFQQALADAMADGLVKPQHKSAFLQQLGRCRAVYQAEIARLKTDFAALPSTSVCHSAQRDLHEGLEIFDAIKARAQLLPLDSEEDRQAAGIFFTRTSPGLVRAVNGLYLLRHGVCMEEERAPFDSASTDSEISHPTLYLE